MRGVERLLLPQIDIHRIYPTRACTATTAKAPIQLIIAGTAGTLYRVLRDPGKHRRDFPLTGTMSRAVGRIILME